MRFSNTRIFIKRKNKITRNLKRFLLNKRVPISVWIEGNCNYWKCENATVEYNCIRLDEGGGERGGGWRGRPARERSGEDSSLRTFVRIQPAALKLCARYCHPPSKVSANNTNTLFWRTPRTCWQALFSVIVIVGLGSRSRDEGQETRDSKGALPFRVPLQIITTTLARQIHHNLK